jgi:hypothetical protein
MDPAKHRIRLPLTFHRTRDHPTRDVTMPLESKAIDAHRNGNATMNAAGLRSPPTLAEGPRRLQGVESWRHFGDGV